MKIKESDWLKYVSTQRDIRKSANAEILKWIAENGMDDRRALIEFANSVLQKYGNASASYACNLFDEIAEAFGEVADAIPADLADIEEISNTVNGVLNKQKNANAIASAMERLVKLAAEDTMMHNAIRKRAFWAWIPSGDSCGFCIMLASKGWSIATVRQLRGDHAKHIHANCDCEFCIKFSGSLDVEGYDPDYYYQMFEDANTDSYGWGSTNNDRNVDKKHWQSKATAKVNALRRESYKLNADKIRAQKRAAYARRKELEKNG